MDCPRDLTEQEIADSYLSKDEVEATRRPTEQASVLPLKIYGNRAFFEREVEHALRPSWHAIAHIDQLREAGAFVTGEIAGEPVIVVRDNAGEIRALANVCRHRGSRLVSGCGTAKLFACPFHAWIYNLDGALRGAPHMDKIEAFDRKSVSLPQYRVEIWNGFVFVNLDPDAAPLAPEVEQLTSAIASYKMETWEVFPWREVEVDWNWKVSMENFSEAYHHVAVHKNSIGMVSKAENALYEESNTKYSLFFVHIDLGETEPTAPGAEYLPDQGERPFPIIAGLPEKFLSYSPVVNIYPTFHLVMGPNFILWLRFEIIAPDKHKMIWHFLAPPGARQMPDLEARLAELDGIMGPVVDEDLAFMPNIQRSVNTRTFSPGRYSDQERAVHQMHRWLMDQMARHNALTAEA